MWTPRPGNGTPGEQSINPWHVSWRAYWQQACVKARLKKTKTKQCSVECAKASLTHHPQWALPPNVHAPLVTAPRMSATQGREGILNELWKKKKHRGRKDSSLPCLQCLDELVGCDLLASEAQDSWCKYTPPAVCMLLGVKLRNALYVTKECIGDQYPNGWSCRCWGSCLQGKKRVYWVLN